MGGICGSFDYTHGRPASRPLLDAMLAAIAHRGGRAAVLARDALALGMRQDGAGPGRPGHPPAGADRGVVLVLDGHIDNLRALAAGLRGRGRRAGAEAEVLLSLYEERGENGVELLRGAFALALWDGRRRRLLLARDRVGARPLYYSTAGGRLAFGSEIKALLVDPDLDRATDFGALMDYLALGHVPAPATLFAEVRALPPGCLANVDARGLRVRRYGDPLADMPAPEAAGSDGPADDVLAELTGLVGETLRRIRPRSRAGAVLLDGSPASAALLGALAEQPGAPPRCVAVSYAGLPPRADPLPAARLLAGRLLAERYCSELVEVRVDAADLVAGAEPLMRLLDQPLADPDLTARWRACDAAPDGSVLFAADGAEALFGWRSAPAATPAATQSATQSAPALARLPAPLRHLAGTAARLSPAIRRHWLTQALRWDGEAARLANRAALFDDDDRTALVAQGLRDCLFDDLAGPSVAAHLDRLTAADAGVRARAVELALAPQPLLTRADRLGPVAGVRVQLPLLDDAILALAHRLPARRGGRDEALLPRLCAHWSAHSQLPGRLPAGGAGGPVQAPLAAWLRGPARAFVRDLLAPDVLARRGLFDPHQVTRLLDGHDRGADHARELLALAQVELWYRVCKEAPIAATATALRDDLAAAHGHAA